MGGCPAPADSSASPDPGADGGLEAEAGGDGDVASQASGGLLRRLGRRCGGLQPAGAADRAAGPCDQQVKFSYIYFFPKKKLV